MGEHILCVIESESDIVCDQSQFELEMCERDWLRVEGMKAFYRYLNSEVSDDEAIASAEADLQSAAENSGGVVPEAVLAIA